MTIDVVFSDVREVFKFMPDTAALSIDVLFSDVREVFDLFDFWDGRDGLIDAVKVGDLLRCVGLNPTVELSIKHGGTKKPGGWGVGASGRLTNYVGVMDGRMCSEAE